MLRLLKLTLFFVLVSTKLQAQGGNRDLGAILDSDGKVKSGVNGSFDASGYSVNLDDRGNPRFLQTPKPASPASITFSAIGNTYGATAFNQSSPACVIVQGSDIYIGGWFTLAGKVVANGIVKWNGSEWVKLGSSFNGNVYALQFIGSDLYAGGSFTKAGTMTVNYIAKWNGTEWSALSGGVNNTVISLTTDGVNLYAGGAFTIAGSTTANYVAKWDGTSWSNLGTGVNSTVYSVFSFGGNLYAGGYFSIAGGVAAKRAAVWNGSTWAELGTGVLGSSASVTEIEVLAGVVYVGGNFSTIDGNVSKYLMGWNGTAWVALGSGINSTPYSLCSDGSFLYVGGSFSTAGGLSSPYMAKWNGTSWSSMGTDITGQVNGIFCSGGTVYLVGTFTQNLALWNGSYSFEPAPRLDVGTSGISVTSICVVGNDIYIGGYFSSVGGVAVNNIAKWNGSEWSALGSGVTGGFSPSPVQALAHDGTYLYAGGFFTNAGGSSISYLAKWNGSSWSSVGGNPNNAVYDIEFIDNKIFVSGYFTSVGGVSANRIAEYSGGVWHALGTGLSAVCFDMTQDGTTLYATGNFITAGGVSAAYIAMWNGSTWVPLGTGLNSSGMVMKFYNGKLYAGGMFTTAGGIAAERAAVWDGVSWSALGTGLPGAPESIEAYGSDIYFGGAFSTAGGVNSPNLAKWNGSNWVAIGTGVDNMVRALCVQTTTGSMIYAGDFLVSNGNVFTQRIAKFTDSDNPLPVELVSFSGSLRNDVIHLNWETATEVDNYGFEVERKTAKSDWMKIGFIDGHGTSNSPKYYSFSDNSILPGEKYLYRLKQIDGDGSCTYSNIIAISASAIGGYTLEQNYPNPYNPETVIRFALPVPGDIRLEVFNVNGEKVATLTDGFREAGVHSVIFRADGMASGVYLYSLVTGDKKLTQKMILLR